MISERRLQHGWSASPAFLEQSSVEPSRVLMGFLGGGKLEVSPSVPLNELPGVL